MKIVFLIAASLFIFGAANAEQPIMIEEANQLSCMGKTLDGDQYKVSVVYNLDPTWLEQMAPYTISTGKRAFVSVMVTRDKKTIYQDALYTNDLMIKQTEDSRSFQLKRIEAEKMNNQGHVVFNDVTTDFLSITMVAEQGSKFDFRLKRASGKFKNGRCTIH